MSDPTVAEQPSRTSTSTLFRTKTIEQILKAGDPIHGVTAAGETGILKRTLGVWDLTAFGVAAIIGAGIFSTVGAAAFDGGPAVVFLFIFTAIACAFSAFCYAEFASAIPVAGSAYTYAYASFGELIAWIIGWDLLMEYAIGNIAVAISWGDYFTHLLEGYGIHIPPYLTLDYLTASRANDQVAPLLAQGTALADLAAKGVGDATIEAYKAWAAAPHLLGLPIIANLPALLITFLITWIVYIGIEESKKLSNTLVALKVAVVIMVIVLGAFYVNPAHWTPFAPNGAGGVLKGVSAVFFAYIGFDAISTTAEECRNPQRDLPRGMIYSLIICTVLYVLVSLVLTGMVSYKQLNVGDPLAYVFGPQGANMPWISGIIGISAIVALSTVLLVFQLGQPRIWMVMSRDGLLPPIFSAIHPKYKTPWFSTIVTGLFVAIPSLFMNLTEVTDLTSIGTLFAFVLVCGGVLRLSPETAAARKFRTPYVNSQWIFPVLCLIAVALLYALNGEAVRSFFGPGEFQHKIPMLVFLVGMAALNFLCFTRKLSLIPVLGLATCGYLMTELGITNWLRFGIWLVVGLFIYFLYGVRHSKLRSA
jgi:amino acid transporter